MIRDKIAGTTVIDLTGPQGNAFFLLGQAERYARQLGLDGDQIITEMKSGNYENLVAVFDHYFGDYVILER
jgi:hypothetical protein